MGSRTPLHQHHIDAGGKMVDFGGWDMPLHYGSQLEEHVHVRSAAGIFDVSHMTVVDLDDAQAFLRELLANDVAKLDGPGQALYGCMLNEDGGIIDDLITYSLGDGGYRLVVNAATRDKDLAWIGERAARAGVAYRERSDLAMIAVQGPEARELAAGLLPGSDRQAALALEPFRAAEIDGLYIARTGYTGEDGWEIMLDADRAPAFWQALLDAGARPCGLGARDTLRLEAGLCLYGQDMDETTTPLESALGWTVALEPEDRSFVGRDALQRQKGEGVPRRLVGALLEGRGVLRPHQVVHTSAGEGEMTSGSYSPTLQRSIGFARLPAGAEGDVEVEIRGKRIPARVTKLCFVRNGEIKIEL